MSYEAAAVNLDNFEVTASDWNPYEPPQQISIHFEVTADH